MESRFDSVLDDRTTLPILLPSEIKEDDSRERSNSKVGKTKFQKEASNSAIYALNKFTIHIKKPPHRKGSPINWFPRRKMDSYLKRKIKMLQELGGLNSTLDETLGDSNPHYSRVLKEKIAVREAANRAMEARTAALVEASWCRILRAARIQNKEAEAQLLSAEQTAADAFEAAAAIGVIMHDLPCCSEKLNEIETSTLGGGGSTTHTVKTSFETAFEVEKEVAAAVKAALIRLSNCSSFNEDEFKEILQKISQKPDIAVENNTDSSTILSECESESGSELETDRQNDSLLGLESKIPALMRNRKGRRRSFEKLNMEKLVEIMLEKLKCLQEREISSLATIVATYGLNAALNELEIDKPHDTSVHPSASARSLQVRKKQVETELPSLDKFFVKHLTKLEREVQEAKKDRREANLAAKADDNDKSESNVSDLGSILLKHSSKLQKEIDEARWKEGKDKGINCKKHIDNTPSEVASASARSLQVRKKQVETELPSLDKFLVKHLTKLEREVQEAKKDRREANLAAKADDNDKSESNVSDLGSILLKHSSKLQKEIDEARWKEGKDNGINCKKHIDNTPSEVAPAVNDRAKGVSEVPSLDKVLVKHVSRLEREVQEAKNRRRNKENVYFATHVEMEEKENNGKSFQHIQKKTHPSEDSLDKILVKPVHWWEREKRKASAADCESLDKVLVKHVSRLEKEKIKLRSEEEEIIVNKSQKNINEEDSSHSVTVSRRDAREKELQEAWGGLSLANSIKPHLKHKSRLERKKMVAAQQSEDDSSHSVTVSRRDAREKELQEAWGGLSLGNSIKPHLSRLERDKAAWKKAEEEERRQAHK